jgi:hypothetical protein
MNDDQERLTGRRSRRAGLTGVILAACAAGLLAAGCSAAPGGPSVASLPGHTAGAGAGAAAPLTVAQGDRDMISFTRCMRSHGVQMPDPFHRPGHQGLSIDIIPSQGSATRIAYSACSHFLQPLIAMKQARAAAQAAPHLQALTNYARCMRGHDIGMLDPTAFGGLNLGNVPGISNTFGRYSPQFRAADAACRHLLPPGVRDDGTGP